MSQFPNLSPGLVSGCQTLPPMCDPSTLVRSTMAAVVLLTCLAAAVGRAAPATIRKNGQHQLDAKHSAKQFTGFTDSITRAAKPAEAGEKEGDIGQYIRPLK